jgi:hypothetical protein
MRPFRTAALFAALALAAAAPAFAQPRDGSHDFDFLIGNWKAHLKRMEKPLSGSVTWIEADGSLRAHKVLDTDANFEVFEVDGDRADVHRKSQTLRLYDPATREWSIYLIDADKGRLGLPPTVGGFRDGKGEFFDMEVFNGRTILVRYRWDPNHGRPHFEQAFSADGGKTWEANWILDLVPDAR